MQKNIQASLLYDHKAGDLFGCSFRFNAFYVKDRLSQLLKLALPGFLLSIALGILVLFFGKEVNGQKRWFAVGPISFQPAEFAKLMLIFMLSSFFIKTIENQQAGVLLSRLLESRFLFFCRLCRQTLALG